MRDLLILSLKQNYPVLPSQSPPNKAGVRLPVCRVSLTLMTVTRKRFSSSSFIAPEMEPMAQHNVFRLFHVNWLPDTCHKARKRTNGREK